jgi:hypothetical protein
MSLLLLLLLLLAAGVAARKKPEGGTVAASAVLLSVHQHLLVADTHASAGWSPRTEDEVQRYTPAVPLLHHHPRPHGEESVAVPSSC